MWSRASAGRPLVVHRRVFFRPSGHLLSQAKYRAVDRFLAVSGAVAESLAAVEMRAQRYDLAVGRKPLWWTGLVALR